MLGLARFTPASSKLFVAIRRLDSVDEALDRAHVWRFLPLLSGHSASALQTGFSLRDALHDFVGDSPDLPFQAIESAELALIAPDLSELDSAVWLARSPDKEAFDAFGRRRANRANLSGAARFFGTRSGLLVSVRGNVVAMARRSAGRASLSDTMLLMSGRHSPSLFDDRQFQALVSYLPAKPLAVAYLGFNDQTKDGATTAKDTLDLDRMTVGMYEGDGLLSFAVRATTFRPVDRPAVSGEAIQRLALLPRTTLLGAAVRIDSPRIGTPARGGASPVLARIKTLLMGLRDPARFRTPFPEIDPNIVVAWDQDLRLGRSTPQVALLLQTPSPAALQQEVAHLVINALKLFDALSPSVRRAPIAVKRRLHLGTSIYSVDLGGSKSGAGHPFEHIVRNIEPSWAIIGKWFAIALSADHLERILDAHRGIEPTLKILPDAYALTQHGRNRTMVVIAQADLAGHVLDEWLADFDAGKPSLLQSRWWGQFDGGRRAARNVTLSTKPAPTGGAVDVVEVVPGVASATGDSETGGVHVGDRIIAVNEKLIDMDRPEDDFRKLLAGGGPDGVLTLRLIRGDRLLDVDIPAPARNPEYSVLVIPSTVVRDLASLAKTVRFASFTSFVTPPGEYAGRLTLRFGADQAK